MRIARFGNLEKAETKNLCFRFVCVKSAGQTLIGLANAAS